MGQHEQIQVAIPEGHHRAQLVEEAFGACTAVHQYLAAMRRLDQDAVSLADVEEPDVQPPVRQGQDNCPHQPGAHHQYGDGCRAHDPGDEVAAEPARDGARRPLHLPTPAQPEQAMYESARAGAPNWPISRLAPGQDAVQRTMATVQANASHGTASSTRPTGSTPAAPRLTAALPQSMIRA